METVVSHVATSNSGSSCSKKSPVSSPTTPTASTEVTGSFQQALSSNVPSTTATTIATTEPTLAGGQPGQGHQTPKLSSPSNTNSNSNSSVTVTNPIFVITNSSLSTSTSSSSGSGGGVGTVPPPSNNNEMPSTSTSSCGGIIPPATTSINIISGGGTGSGATTASHSEEDDGSVDTQISQAGISISTSAVVPNPASVPGTTTTTAAASRSSNPRQSTLTRSHAITLDEDSDSGAGSAEVNMNIIMTSQPLPPEQEQELIHFIIDTCNKSAKDKNFILRIEADLIQFVKDESRQTLPFPQMTSYQRMLVHRMATLFDLDHNVDNTSGGNFVVVSKDLNGAGTGHGGRIPSIRFKELQATPINPAMIVSSTSSSHLNTFSLLEHNSATASSQEDLTPTNSSAQAGSSKKILKREKPTSGTDNKKGGVGGVTKTKSLEERTQDYHKARRRIFEDSCDSSPGMSLENSNSASSKKLNWSSTDSSEDRMYLKPPFPSASGKLIKVESFESASQKKSSNRDSRQMGKSHSFGGYEDNTLQQQHSLPSGGPSRGGGSSRGGSSSGGGAINNASSNNASSSMISCSSSSSLRSSSFSKQDSSSSTTSGSGQSPSGATSSGSTSGYKSGSSGGGGSGSGGTVQGHVTGYYVTTPTGGMSISTPVGVGIGANTMGTGAAAAMGPAQMGPVAIHQSSAGDMIKSTPAIIFAPPPPHPQHQAPLAQPEEALSPTSSSSNNSSQPVLFCCWAVTDLSNVPPGAVIIDPGSGQSVKNTDGTHYYYDPSNPPKLVQAIPAAPHSHPPPPSTPQQQESYPPASVTVSGMYPPQTIYTGPAIYSSTPLQQPPQTPTGSSHQQQHGSYMTMPTGGIAGASQPIYFSSPTQIAPGGTPDTQDLSGYFSQMSVGGGGTQSGRASAPASVIYVPVDTLGVGATAYVPQQDQPTSQGGYYEDPTPQTVPLQAQQIPVQFQAPSGTGYVFQPVMDTTSATASGGGGGGVYYYGGNFVQASGVQSAVSSTSSTPTSNQHHYHQQHQPPTQSQRFKHWIGVSQQQQHQHHGPVPPSYGIHHGSSSQVGGPPPGGSGSIGSQQQQHPVGAPPPPPPAGTIMIHSNAPANSSMISGPAGLVSVIPPLGHLSSAQIQQQPQSGIGSAGQPTQAQSNAATLVPLSYHHPSPQPPPPQAMGGTQPPTIMVPCVQSPVFPPPSQHQHQSQSFVPPHHPPPPTHHHHHHHHSPSASSTPRHHAPQSHSQQHQPRFLAVTGPSAAVAAATSQQHLQQQQQQQHQQQLQLQFLANAAAAAMMSNNYSFAASTAAGVGVARFLKAGGRGAGGTPHHGAVTGVVRRSRNYPIPKQLQNQQQNSSK